MTRGRGRRAVVAVALALLAAACSRQITIEPPPGNVWLGPGDGFVPPDTVRIHLAPEPCDTERLAFLEVDWPLPGYEGEGEPGLRQYVRDPAGEADPRRLLAPYDGASTLPSGAAYTGYHTEDFQLWIGPDVESYVYLVAGSRVEALPRAEEPIVCR